MSQTMRMAIVQTGLFPEKFQMLQKISDFFYSGD